MKRETIKHRGIKIVTVQIPRYEVRHVDGRLLTTFSNLTAAKAWIDAYLAVTAFSGTETAP